MQTLPLKGNVHSISEVPNYAQHLLKIPNFHLLSVTRLTFGDLRKKRFFWRGSFEIKANSPCVLSTSYPKSLFLLSFLLKSVISSADSWAHALSFFKKQTTTESFTAHLTHTNKRSVKNLLIFFLSTLNPLLEEILIVAVSSGSQSVDSQVSKLPAVGVYEHRHEAIVFP